MRNVKVIEIIGTFLLLIRTLGCSELFEYTELGSYRNSVGNVGIVGKFDLSTYSVPCWRLCHRNSQCSSYFENSINGKCYLVLSLVSEDQVEAEYGWKYFIKTSRQIQLGTSCPIELGYVFDGGTSLCIKLLTEGKMHRPQAIGNCTKDGGRLLQIKNEEQQVVLANYMQTFYPSNSPLIDGVRSDSDGPWAFEDGELLSYFKWAENEPTSSKMCIRVSRQYSFNWTSALCSVRNLHLCEIPIQDK